jgi:hypothetical protein
MQIVRDSSSSKAAITAFATVCGGSEGTRNLYHAADGRDILENSGVKVCPGKRRVVRILGVLYLEGQRKSEKEDDMGIETHRLSNS